MYVKNDPRSSLQPIAPAGQVHEEFFGCQLSLFYDTAPQFEAAAERTWIARGQSFIVVYSECEAGARLARDDDQPDEYALIIPDAGTVVEITDERETVEVPGYSIAFVPPKRSEIEVKSPGRVVRLFSPNAHDLVRLASNADAFTGEHPNVPPFEPWPDPPDGFRIRHYSLDVPEDPKRFGRIFRCTTFMINYLNPRHGPRDRTAVSPHYHDDFEQCSLALSGTFTHHLRWPWTTNMTKWKKDEHHFCRSPSICVIPPPAIHTTTAEGEGLNQLVDIFAPPRLDFSNKEGWVLNSDEYPMKES